MTTKEVSEKYGVCIASVARWAKNNGVRRGEPVNGIMPFDWTEDDCRRFEQRRGKGWKKGVPRKKEKQE
ncbi:MAG: DNA-binding protein [Treponema sp.]|nr:DNA-binding protein [Treponema sp.]